MIDPMVRQLRAEVRRLRQDLKRATRLVASANVAVRNVGTGRRIESANTLTPPVEVVSQENAPAWAADAEYPTGKAVRHNDQHYVCRHDNDGSAATEPGVGADWAEYWWEALTPYRVYTVNAATGGRQDHGAGVSLWPVWAYRDDIPDETRGLMSFDRHGARHLVVPGEGDGNGVRVLPGSMRVLVTTSAQTSPYDWTADTHMRDGAGPTAAADTGWEAPADGVIRLASGLLTAESAIADVEIRLYNRTQADGADAPESDGAVGRNDTFVLEGDGLAVSEGDEIGLQIRPTTDAAVDTWIEVDFGLEGV